MMRIAIKWKFIPALLILGATFLGAGRIVSASELTFDAQAGLPIRLGEQVIADKQTQSWTAPGSERVLRAQDILTFWGPHSRREFARIGNRLEYTFQFNLPATEERLSSCLFLPLPRGGTAKIVHGSHSRVVTTDTVTIDNADRSFSLVRFITVNGAGKDEGFAIDTDPAGSWQDSADFDKQLGQCEVKITPAGLQLCFARGYNRWGQGRIRAKLVFHAAPVEFESQHPFSVSGYKQPLQTMHFLDFTNRSRTKSPLSVTTEKFDSQRGYGWTNSPPDLTIVDRSPRALLHSGFATATGPATFQMTAPPGEYFLSISVGDLEKSVEMMSVSVNGKPWLTNLRAGKAQIENRHTVVSTSDGVVTLTLTGQPWVLNSLALQPLMLANEDYQMRRTWWLHTVDWTGEKMWPALKPTTPKPEN